MRRRWRQQQQAEERARQLEEGRQQAEERARQLEEGRQQAEERARQLEQTLSAQAQERAQLEALRQEEEEGQDWGYRVTAQQQGNTEGEEAESQTCSSV